MKNKSKKEKDIKEKAEHIERSAIEIINDLADKAMDFTSDTLDKIEDALQ